MIRALALMLMASPAFAQTHEWGTGTAGPSSVTVVETPEGYAVTFSNRLVHSVSVQSFDVGDIHIRIVSENAQIADRMFVVAPVGWYCQPCDVTVEENGQGTVHLLPQLLG
jgi:hypothetical protein